MPESSERRGAAQHPTIGEIDLLAEELRNLLADQLGPVAVGLLALEPDGSLWLAGAAGIPAPVAAAWGHIPARLPTAAVEVVRTGRARWLPSLADARRRYVLIGDPDVAWPSRVHLPLRDRRRIVGLASVFCRTPHAFDPATRRSVAQRVAGLASRFAELLRRHAHQMAWAAEAQAILDQLSGAVALTVPVRDAGGRVVDYQIAAASPGAVDAAGRQGRDLVGLRTVRAYPSLAGGDLLRVFTQVLKTGQAREIGPFTYTAETGDAVYSVSAHRLGPGLLISWLRHDEGRRYAERLARTERLGNLGWAEWDLTAGTAYWSDQLYEIIGRDPASGPVPPRQLAGIVVPTDVKRVERAADDLLAAGRSMDVTCRVRVAGEMRHVRALFEAVHDANGRPVRAYGILQDVTAVQDAARDRRRLAHVERQLLERQRAQQTEHRLVAALQQIIMPVPKAPVERPGLQIGVRFQPAEELSRVGGDWYDLVSLSSGHTLVAVGDVAGHGIAAAASMARLRHALTALAVTTDDPAELLCYLNRLVCDDPAEPTATAVVARYDPDAETLTWAQAGHPPPILISDGGARPVDRPVGMLVGARRDTRYANAELRLPVDSRLLLYTDGLIERRGRFEPDWLGPLLAEVAGGERESVDVLLRRLQPANPDDDTCMLLLRPLRT